MSQTINTGRPLFRGLLGEIICFAYLANFTTSKTLSTIKELVIVVEGEKSADASQFVLPDCVVNTSMGGARSAGKINWRPLKNRQVII
jgi:hypothetical protein